MINHWKARLLESAAEWDLPRTGKWSFLFYNNYQPDCSYLNNLTLLWFHNGDRFPRVVTKVFREPQLPTKEFDNLKHAYQCAPACVPKPFQLASQGEFWMLWMEGVPGLPFSSRNSYRPTVMRSMVDMVASMHRAVRREGKVDPDRYCRAVSEPLQTLMQFGGSASIREGCARVAALITDDWVNSQPVIPQHGDLFRNNVLAYKGKWHVIDWESFGIVDFPLYDLLTLLFSLLRGGELTPDQWDRSLVKQVPLLIDCYLERLGLSRADVPVLLPLTMANWFHLAWCDGRKEFTVRMYSTIQHYFEHQELWERCFFRGLLGEH